MKKLNYHEVKEIEELLYRTYKVKDIAAEFGVCGSTVSNIGNNPRYMFKKPKHLQIWDMHHNMLTVTAISKIYNVDRNIIYSIKQGKYLKNHIKKVVKNEKIINHINLYVKYCVYCDKKFTAKGKSTRFCSRRCGSLSNSDIFRKNMIEHNPMKREDIKLKVASTLKEGYISGRISKTFGKNHPKWKGTRTFSNYCRLRLYHSWIFPILKRDKFKCTNCRCTTQLQVHHINSLRSIISNVLTENNISEIESLSESYKYEELINKVVDRHTLSDGITVCHACHSMIDERYRRITYETQTSKQKRLRRNSL